MIHFQYLQDRAPDSILQTHLVMPGATFPNLITDEDMAITRAVVLGDTSGMTETSYFLFGLSGLGHILSASGFHLVVAALCARFFCRALVTNLGPTRAPNLTLTILESVGVLAFALLFTLVSGRAAPTVRALAALALLTVTLALGRRLRPVFLLALSALAAAACGRGGTLSLALSLTAVAALYASPRLLSSSRVPRFAHGFLGLTCAPWLATLPLLALAFHSVSLASPAFNLVFAPWLAVGTLLPGLCALALDGLGSTALAAPLWTIANASTAIARLALEKTAAEFAFGLWVEPALWTAAWSCFALAWLVLRERKKRNVAIVLLGIGLRFLASADAREPRAFLLDAGQGDALALLTPGEAPFLIDSGGTARAPYPARAVRAFSSLGRSEIAGLLLTHPDNDHAGGAASLLLRHPLAEGGAVWIRTEQLEFFSIRRVLRALERQRATIRFLDDAAEGAIYPGLACRGLPARARDTNDSSPLCKFTLADGQTLLLTGDMSSARERAFAERMPDFLRATHLKVAHHGSRSSSSPAFLAAVDAKVALISAGERNRYGHPSALVLDRLRRFGLLVRRTDLEGTIPIP